MKQKCRNILYPYVLLLSHIKVEFAMLLSYFTFINVFDIGLEFFSIQKIIRIPIQWQLEESKILSETRVRFIVLGILRLAQTFMWRNYIKW